jgi:hypothetical protein
MHILKSFIPKRTWLRFSLATFLLAVAVIAFGCKWVLDRVHLYAGQYDRLASLSSDPELFRRLHPPVVGRSGLEGERHEGKGFGSVRWTFAAPGSKTATVAEWLGIDYQVDVVRLGISGARIDFLSDMELASRLPMLKELDIRGQTISEDIVAAIKKMKGLETLYFTDTDVNEESAAALKKVLPHVQIKVSGRIGRSVRVIELP